MWQKSNKVWLEWQGNILTVDVFEGIFLAAFLQHVKQQRLHTHQLEIIDLQRYKIITKPKIVYQAIRERAQEPFVFIFGKN
ncbi:MAG: hypothetical protein JST88_02120 [Bacteroidetes bacterium]|nr:hypothetical protein [Bacteroidota bacterium]